MSKTTVIFRKWTDSRKDVVALFPLIDESQNRCLSYMHVGQHSIADYGHIISVTDPAQPHEYADLKAELEQIGYSLKIRTRRPKWSAEKE